MNRSLFVSTAIPYVNAAPHLGFALEMVLADALARHARGRGEDVRFVSGTDENSLKNVRAAEAAGVTTRELVDANSARFRALGRALDLSVDDFVRTSEDPRHAAAVRAFWEACRARGDLEKRAYRGLYCVGCEAFLDAEDLTRGACPEHGAPPEGIEEENWFFRLSHYEGEIRDALARGVLRVEPKERAHEVARFVASGLRDVSVSRSRARARDWGIEVPGDPQQVVYVWFDALANYVASLGFPERGELYERYWARAGRRVHVVGKGIARFHAVLWPALLTAAGAPLPTTIWAHGYLTVDGQKIGKSRGNAVDPNALVSRFGVDAVRYFLLRHCGATHDADVTEARIAAVYDAELADALGNLAHRTLALVRRDHDGEIPEAPPAGIDPSGEALAARARALGAAVDEATDRLAPDEALRAVFAIVGAANKHLADTAPWAAAKRGDRPRAAASVHHACLALGSVGEALAPFLPSTSRALASALAEPARSAPALFPKERRASLAHDTERAYS